MANTFTEQVNCQMIWNADLAIYDHTNYADQGIAFLENGKPFDRMCQIYEASLAGGAGIASPEGPLGNNTKDGSTRSKPLSPQNGQSSQKEDDHNERHQTHKQERKDNQCRCEAKGQ